MLYSYKNHHLMYKKRFYILCVFTLLSIIFVYLTLKEVGILKKDNLMYQNKINKLSNSIYTLEEKIQKNDDLIKEMTIEKDIAQSTIKELNDKNAELNNKINSLEKNIKTLQTTSRGGTSRSNVFQVTAYDLSYESTGKRPGDKYYGITAGGINLKGQTWESAKAIAVDPTIIPLGSLVKVTFHSEAYAQFNSIYTAVDTGGAIKGNIIDLYLGENVDKKTISAFGRQKATIEIIRKGK